MVPHWVPHFQIQIAIDLKRMGTPGTPKSHSLSLSRLECQALYHVPTCHIFWWIHGIKNLSVLTHRHLHRSDGTSHASSDSRTSTAGIVGGFFLGNRRKLQLKDSSNWTLPGKTICWLVVTGTMEFYDFPYIGNNDPNWLKKNQRGRYTTNQRLWAFWALNNWFHSLRAGPGSRFKRFPKPWYPYSWMFYFMENPKNGWFAGTPILGNPHMTYMKYASAEGLGIICHWKKASWSMFKACRIAVGVASHWLSNWLSQSLYIYI